MKILFYISALLIAIALVCIAFNPLGPKQEVKPDIVTVIRSEALKGVENPPKVFIYKRPRPPKEDPNEETN